MQDENSYLRVFYGGEIINRIYDLRKASGLTQKELADKCEVTQSALSRWENGCPPLKKYRAKLVKLLDCTEDDLMD